MFSLSALLLSENKKAQNVLGNQCHFFYLNLKYDLVFALFFPVFFFYLNKI